MDSCGGLDVIMLAFYNDDPSSNAAEVYDLFCKAVVEKTENKQKEAGVDPMEKLRGVAQLPRSGNNA